MDKTINQGDSSQLSSPEQTSVIPPEVSIDKSVSEEVRTSRIPSNIFDMEKNVNIGDGVLTTETHGNLLVSTLVTFIQSSSFEVINFDTLTSLPSFSRPIHNTLPQSTTSPTFENIMEQSITSLFPSKSTNGPKSITVDDTTKNGEYMGSFAEIQFDPEEENIRYHILMSGKHFKILNRKVYSLLQLQAANGGRRTISVIKVNVMLKDQELCLKDTLDRIDKNNELPVKTQSYSFNHELKELKSVAKERYVLFVKDVKSVRENVTFKIEELRTDMAKEIVALDHNYSSLYTMVDIIVDAVTKVFMWYNFLLTKVDKNVEVDAQSFGKIEELLGNLKELISKFGSLASSLLTPEFLTHKFRLLESTFHNELDPLVKFVNLMPTDAPPVH